MILLDTTFWGGIRPCIKAAGVCETMGVGVAVHSSGELGIQLATMLHMGAVVPNLGYAADAHYHHLIDDVIAGGRMRYENGAIRVPDGRASASRSTARSSRNITSSTASSAAIRTIATRAARAGTRSAEPRLGGPERIAAS